MMAKVSSLGDPRRQEGRMPSTVFCTGIVRDFRQALATTCCAHLRGAQDALKQEAQVLKRVWGLSFRPIHVSQNPPDYFPGCRIQANKMYNTVCVCWGRGAWSHSLPEPNPPPQAVTTLTQMQKTINFIQLVVQKQQYANRRNSLCCPHPNWMWPFLSPEGQRIQDPCPAGPNLVTGPWKGPSP